jgi:hypothetical protein
MSKRASDERRRFLEIKKRVDEAIKDDATSIARKRIENLRKQRSEAINMMQDAFQRGDFMAAKYYEYVVQQCSIALKDPY